MGCCGSFISKAGILEFMLSIIRGFIQYAAAPAFLVMAGANYLVEASGRGHQSGYGEGPMPGMIMLSDTLPDQLTALLASPVAGSMWLMYSLMGIAHLLPWIPGSKTD